MGHGNHGGRDLHGFYEWGTVMHTDFFGGRGNSGTIKSGMSEAQSLRILVISDQTIIRHGLASLVDKVHGLELVGEGNDLSELGSLCKAHLPDLMILHTKTGDLEALQAARQQAGDTTVLVMVEAGQTCKELPFLSLTVSEGEFVEALQKLVPLPARPTSPAVQPFRSTMRAVGVAVGGRSTELVVQELAQAGQMQARILPDKPPSLPGWDIAARLMPARETSGDLYDFIPISDNKWGFLVADVADKGMGAALVMSMASTLFRSYAGRHVTLPAIALDSVNARLHSDTRGGVFLSAFLGILEPHTGRMRYANAGHPPPIHIRQQRNGRTIERLERTGMVLGVLENYHWKQKMVEIGHEDVLVLYTDGVLDAQNEHGSFFEIERLEEIVWQHSARPADEILNAVLEAVQGFTQQEASIDDQAVVVMRRLK